MPTNLPNNTQKIATDRLKSTREKLTRKIKLALKTATPEETLEVWMLMKRQETQENDSWIIGTADGKRRAIANPRTRL